jgi:hypothetical protein
MSFQWIFEEKPVYAHSFVVGHQMVAVIWLSKEYIVWEYGVCHAFTFENK